MQTTNTTPYLPATYNHPINSSCSAVHLPSTFSLIHPSQNPLKNCMCPSLNPITSRARSRDSAHVFLVAARRHVPLKNRLPRCVTAITPHIRVVVVDDVCMYVCACTASAGIYRRHGRRAAQ